jgi:replicative DNA helicase
MEQPHSIDLERSILGAVLVDAGLMVEIRDRIFASDFFRMAYQRVFEAYGALADSEGAISPSSVQQAMVSKGWGDEMSFAQLSALTDGIPRGFAIGDAADQLRDLAERRRLQALCRLTEQSVVEADSSESAALDLVRQTEAIVEMRAHGGSTLRAALETLTASLDEPALVAPTGLSTLDRWGCGFRPGELVILAGRPSHGKTALALHMARVLAGAGHRVWMASLEMSEQALTMRWLASEAQVDLLRLRGARLTDVDYTRVSRARETLSDLPITIDDHAGVGLADIRRAAVGQSGVIIVDYLQLLRPPTAARDYRNRVQEVGAISRGLKAIAHDAKVSVLALSQLSRAVESRQEKAPLLSDLRDSGELEQDADQVWMLWRPHLYNEHEDSHRAVLKVAKHRNGPTGTVELWLEPSQGRFREATLQEIPAPPPARTRSREAAEAW